MNDPFQPPKFESHPWIRGGHLQTMFAVRGPKVASPAAQRHVVTLEDGDAIVLHETRPVDATSERSIALIHGLAGCHGSPYMIRLTDRLVSMGWTVYRVDMRGCGAAENYATNLTHAGRSDDVAAAIGFIAEHDPRATLQAVGVSLGGNQLLRMVGRIGAGHDVKPPWFERLQRIAVVAPPMDLARCAKNMQRVSRRVYNYYLIRLLFERIPPKVRARADFHAIEKRRRPKTLYELDDFLTAPLSGFADADEYHHICGASAVSAENPVETLVLAAKDDPIVPVDCFDRSDWPATTTVHLAETGGHNGFVSRDGSCWMDRCVASWVNHL